MMQENQMVAASAYFNENWKRYQDTIQHNVLYHREMSALVLKFLDENFKSRSFSLVDVGCGDSTFWVPFLSQYPVEEYIGIDAAPDVLLFAKQNLETLSCEKEFIAADMKIAVPALSSTYDVIFTSYAVHHLSTSEKQTFLDDCYRKLNPNGYLLMIDGVRQESQSREEWLQALANRMKTAIPALTPNDIQIRMEHPNADDYPENLEILENMGSKWSDFQVLLQTDISAFLIFKK